jgi:DNA repair protein RecN (Recombination protein N)
VNNQPVTLQDLKALGELLIDIHGQHAHQSLLDGANQRALLDAHGGLTALAERVADAYAAWRQLDAELDRRRTAGDDRAAQLELLRFQAGELDALALRSGEPAALQVERGRLANTDRLIAGVSGALGDLYENEPEAAYTLVVQAEQSLAKLGAHDTALAAAAQRLAAVAIEVRELASDLAHYRERIEADPERLEWLDHRLAKVRSLARRHNVSDDDLPNVLPALQQRIAELEGGAEALEALRARAAAAREQYFAAAGALSVARRKHARTLEKQVTAQLAELGMPHGELHVHFEPKPAERADATGLERIELQVKLNPDQPFGALAKVASGGELSRLSLALEVVRSGASPVLSFVFDEVDAGVGGRVAEIVGRRLRELATKRQVLCVTHLPQVASQGQRHYRVMKMTDGKTSRTNVRELSSDERVEELSRMLGGIEITERTRAHAAEMIDRAAK